MPFYHDTVFLDAVKVDCSLLAVSITPTTFIAEILEAAARFIEPSTPAHLFTLVHQNRPLPMMQAVEDSNIQGQIVHVLVRQPGQAVSLPPRAQRSLLSYGNEDLAASISAGKFVAEVLADHLSNADAEERICSMSCACGGYHRRNCSVLEASLLLQAEGYKLSFFRCERIDRKIQEVARWNDQRRRHAQTPPVLAAAFVAQSRTRRRSRTFPVGMARADDAPAQFPVRSLDEKSFPSLPSAWKGLTVIPIDASRRRHPLFQNRPEDDLVTAARPESPAELLATVRRHISQLASGRQAAPRPRYFDEVRKDRRQFIEDGPNWAAHAPHDLVVAGEVAQYVPTLQLMRPPLQHVKVAYLTTFPVSIHGMHLHAQASQGGTRLASTTKRMVFLWDRTIPHVKSETLWFDVNPCARECTIKTVHSSELDCLFLYGDSMLAAACPDLIVCQMVVNQELIIDASLPRYVTSHMPKLEPRPVAKAAPEDFDRYWVWADEDDSDCRSITSRELALFIHLNLLDLSTVLPCGPKALFFRRYQGHKYHRIVLFTPHICTLDQMAFEHATFESALAGTERATFSISALFSEGLRNEVATEALDDYVQSISPQGEASLTRREFSLTGYAGQVLVTPSGKVNLVEKLRELRRMEMRHQTALDDRLSPVLLEYVAMLLVASGDADDLPGYSPRPPRNAKGPSSLVSDALAALQSLGVAGLARRETEEKKRSIKPIDQRLLDQARRSPLWRRRLKDRFNLSFPGDLPADAFTRAKKLHTEHKQTALSDSGFVKLALANAGPQARHLWYAHEKLPNRLKLGFLRSRHADGYYQMENDVRIADVDANPCDRCDADGFDGCLTTYKSAVESGRLQQALQHGWSDVYSALSCWLEVLNISEAKALSDEKRAFSKEECASLLELSLANDDELSLPGEEAMSILLTDLES